MAEGCCVRAGDVSGPCYLRQIRQYFPAIRGERDMN